VKTNFFEASTKPVMTKRRVLIVVSSYAPAMIADMQRARMLAWELPKLGWEVEILAPNSRFQNPSCLDTDSEGFFPPNVTVHSFDEWFPLIFSKLKMRSIGWRALRPLRSHGLKLLESGRFDLVFFSTTQFCLFLAGPFWWKRTGIPYVLDFHDPCYKEQRGPVETTRHPFKHGITRRLLKYIELWVVQEASALVSVSPLYVEVLKARYESIRPAWFKEHLCPTIPFGAREEDLLEGRRLLSPRDGHASEVLRLIYVGAGGGIMIRAFTLICQALAVLRQQGNPLVSRVRIELFGTTPVWRKGDLKHLEQVAIDQGVGDLVKEYPERASYRRSLELLLEADGTLILGVDDAGYMPSKLFSYVLSGHPLLASLRRESPAYAHFQATPGLGHALWFNAQGEMPVLDAASEVGIFLEEVAVRQTFDRRAILEPNLAPAMAQRHAELFEAILVKN